MAAFWPEARPRSARGRRRARGHRTVVHQADLAGCTCACITRTRFASVIGVSGWWRMPVRQQQVAHEQMALEHRAAVLRKAGLTMGEAAAQLGHQRLGHRADVARGVESKVEQTLK